jgi:hypothetical protein
VTASIIDPLDGSLRALREIQAPQHLAAADDRKSGFRISSAAFRPGTDGTVSVDLEESLTRAGLPVNARYPSMPRTVGLAAITIDAIRTLGPDVAHDPIPNNAHHGVIREGNVAISKNGWRRVARAIADQCDLIVPIASAT